MNTPYRTIVDTPPIDIRIGYHTRLMSIGSCFSEHIGAYFQQRKFSIVINPYGQQYNPFSIAIGIQRLINPIPYTADNLIYHQGLYHSLDHHGSYSHTDSEMALTHINQSLSVSAKAIREAEVLMLTFGTAHTYRHIDTQQIVSNCHQLPNRDFQVEMLPISQIVTAIGDSILALRAINPNIKILFTLSPVRYFALGHLNNTLSKSILTVAIHELVKNIRSCYYFPAYELVIDDLRDYRFYATDMLHPSEEAIRYVWERLYSTLIPSDDLTTMREIEGIQAAVAHRPRNPNSEAHQAFVTTHIALIKELEIRMGLDFKAEREMLLRDAR